MPLSAHSILSVLQEGSTDSGSGEPRQQTTNYPQQLGDFSNENWGWIVMGGFALFLLIMIRRAFKR